jgi:hypothetical protein
MDAFDVIKLIAGGGIPYADARPQIQSGDLLLLHHDFVASWYGVQIEAVQLFTGPFAHIAVLDRIDIGGDERVVVWESVVPKERVVPVSATADQGFFWISLRKPMTTAERDFAWNGIGVREYSKEGAVLAGLDRLPADEDANERRWCAKSANLMRRRSDVDLGPRYVPTDMALSAMRKYGARLQYVRMQ